MKEKQEYVDFLYEGTGPGQGNTCRFTVSAQPKRDPTKTKDGKGETSFDEYPAAEYLFERGKTTPVDKRHLKRLESVPGLGKAKTESVKEPKEPKETKLEPPQKRPISKVVEGVNDGRS